MPQQSSPPYPEDAGAFTSPRQLYRWLDIQAQNGPLRRTETYITLPVFSISDVVWNGYSDIVYAVNFEAQHNFSLNLDFVTPVSPNYVLCISYHIGEIVTRYILWDATGSNTNLTCPVYSGQPILKNFRLEVWNTEQGTASNAAALNFYTSALNPYDYRYQLDSPLSNPTALVTDFDIVAETVPALPLDINNLPVSHFTSSFGLGAYPPTWTSINSINTITGDGIVEEFTVRGNTFNGVVVDVAPATGATSVVLHNYLYVLFQANLRASANYSDNLIYYNNSYQVSMGKTAGVPFVEVNGTNLTGSSGLVDGGMYILVCIAGVQAFLVELFTQEQTEITNIAVTISASTTVSLLAATSPVRLVEIIPYTSLTQFQTIYQYLFGTYAGSFPFPLTFPDNSASTTN